MSKKLDGIYRAKTLYDGLWKLYEGKTALRYTTGIDELDPIMRLIKPSFILMTGVPNCGKSSLTFQILMETAKKHDFKWFIYSPESSLEVNLKRLIEKFVKKTF